MHIPFLLPNIEHVFPWEIILQIIFFMHSTFAEWIRYSRFRNCEALLIRAFGKSKIRICEASGIRGFYHSSIWKFENSKIQDFEYSGIRRLENSNIGDSKSEYLTFRIFHASNIRCLAAVFFDAWPLFFLMPVVFFDAMSSKLAQNRSVLLDKLVGDRKSFTSHFKLHIYTRNAF